MAVADILRRAAMCSGLTEEELELVSAITAHVEFGTGDIIFEEGSACDELYLIESGEIDILVGADDYENYTTNPDEIIITTLRRGQSFGEMALVSQGIRAATARCAQHESILLVIPRRQLMNLFDAYPRLGYKVMYNLAADLAGKIRATDIMIQERVTWAGLR